MSDPHPMSRNWRLRLSAMTTPLASIFGSGFLVIVSVLGGSVGPWSAPTMAGICVLAYAVGSVIRHNIRSDQLPDDRHRGGSRNAVASSASAP